MNPASSLRDIIRAELEATRLAYHALLSEVPETDWPQPSSNPAWTIGEVLAHLILAPRMLFSDVVLIRRLGWLPLPPAFIFHRLNEYVTRRMARNATRQSLAAQYEAAHVRTLQALDSIHDADWMRSAQYPDWDPLLSGRVTLETLFHYPARHFEAHAAEIRTCLGRRDV